ncbi:hypothetical protein [Dyella sp.]|jgi:hypothetical protein|uniref:ArnT family glycosyltransferase n=1 Tax=Dyella sp. TaxID=1869338 RepID=UPI002D799EC5|nr:hypothetical protein [Dyella sp.]HET6430811.1 hypothetical protein [Dyella sp.]
MIKKIAARTIRWLANSSITAALLLLAAGEALGLVATAAATAPLAKGLASSPLLWLAAVLMALVVAAVLVTSHRTSRRPQPFRPALFLPALIGTGVVVHLLLVAFVRPSWGTDYLRYWQHAQEMVREHKYGGFSGPYYSRALLIPYAIIRLFGPDSILMLKLANVVLLTGIQLFGYDILRRVKSHQAAQAASLLFLAAPMPAFATLIPSHDLWGLFFFSAAAWTLTLAVFRRDQSVPSIARCATLAVVTGLLAYLTELQRGTGSIFTVALVGAAVLIWLGSYDDPRSAPERSRARTGLFVAALCLGSMVAAGQVGDRLGLNPNPRTSLFMMKIAANSGGMGNGKSDWYARFRDRFGVEQATDETATDFAKTMALSAWTLEPLERGAHLAGQAQRLFELHYPADWNWMLRHPDGLPKTSRHLLLVYAGEYAMGLGIWFVWSLCLLATSRRLVPLPVLTASLSILLLAATLLLLFENKPFNIFPVWLAICLVIGSTFDGTASRAARTPWHVAFRQRIGTAAAGIVLAAGAMTLLLFGTSMAYSPSSGQILSDWSLETSQRLPKSNDRWELELLDARPEAFDPSSYDPETLSQSYIRHAGGDGDRIQRHAGSTVTRMQFPAPVAKGDHLTLKTSVCLKNPERNNLEFFAFAPLRNAGSDAMTLTVSVNEKTLGETGIPFSRRNFRRFFMPEAFVPGKCQELSFRLRAEKTFASAKDSPFVEIWIPRLVEGDAAR